MFEGLLEQEQVFARLHKLARDPSIPVTDFHREITRLALRAIQIIEELKQADVQKFGENVYSHQRVRVVQLCMTLAECQTPAELRKLLPNLKEQLLKAHAITERFDADRKADAVSSRQSKNAKAPRKKVSREEIEAYRDDYKTTYGKERGWQTSARLHFHLAGKTLRDRLIKE